MKTTVKNRYLFLFDRDISNQSRNPISEDHRQERGGNYRASCYMFVVCFHTPS